MVIVLDKKKLQILGIVFLLILISLLWYQAILEERLI